MVNLIPDMNPANEMTKILLYSTQLAANYEKWENNNEIQNVLDTNKNSLCQMIKISHPQLDEKSIKCIVLGMYINMFNEISNISNISNIANNF
jgi:hypothetical protein